MKPLGLVKEDQKQHAISFAQWITDNYIEQFWSGTYEKGYAPNRWHTKQFERGRSTVYTTEQLYERWEKEKLVT